MSSIEQNLYEIQTINEVVENSLRNNDSIVRFKNYRIKNYHFGPTNFFLLDVNWNQDSCSLKIAGSTKYLSNITKNVYNVTINVIEKKIQCDCPDGAGYCKTNNIICKHSYFVLIKVLRLKELALPHSMFFQTNVLSEAEVLLIFQRITAVWENRRPEQQELFMNPEFSTRYETYIKYLIQTQGAQTTLDQMTENIQTIEEQFSCLQIKTGEEQCSICHTDMTMTEDLAKCPSCNNNFHTSCIKKWIEVGKTTCVLCRSPVWEQYKKINGSPDNIYHHTYTNLFNHMIG